MPSPPRLQFLSKKGQDLVGAFCLSLSFVCRSFVLLFVLAVHHHCICCTTVMKAEIIFPRNIYPEKLMETWRYWVEFFPCHLWVENIGFLECHSHKLSAISYRFPHSLWYIFKIIWRWTQWFSESTCWLWSLEFMLQGTRIVWTHCQD